MADGPQEQLRLSSKCISRVLKHKVLDLGLANAVFILFGPRHEHSDFHIPRRRCELPHCQVSRAPTGGQVDNGT